MSFIIKKTWNFFKSYLYIKFYTIMVIGHRQNIKVYRETDLTLIFKRWFNGVKASLSTEQSLVFIGLVQKHFMISYSKKKSKKRVNIILKKSRKKKNHLQ